jgi:cytochrome bd ubiquinol oxidase subunit I
MVSLETLFSSFWILANNSWMQVPVGHQIVEGKIVPSDWKAIIAGPVFLVRWVHMLLAAFLTTSMCVIATGAWYLLRDIHRPEARAMMHWGMGLAAVLVPVQLFFGHLNVRYVVHHQPSKIAAIEARWHDEKPASEVLPPGRMRRSGETSSRSLCRRRFSLQTRPLEEDNDGRIKTAGPR